MRRFAALTPIVLTLALGLTGCGGGHDTPVNAPATLKFTPSTLSLARGQVGTLSAFTYDASGNSAAADITLSSSNDKMVSVTNSGLVCAGQWDSTTTPVVCCPGAWQKDSNGKSVCQPDPSLIGSVTVTANAKSGSVTLPPQTATVFVHSNVDRVEIKSGATDLANCVTKNTSAANTSSTLTAVACSNSTTGPIGACSQGTDVTDSVGPFSWSLSAAVGVFDTTGATCNYVDSNGVNTCVADASGHAKCNLCTLSAGSPGQGKVTASVGNTVSTPVNFTTCPVKSISLAFGGTPPAPTSIAVGGSVALTATVIDSAGNDITAATTVAPLTWLSSQPAIVKGATATTGSAGTASGSGAGTSTVLAECGGSNCNIGFWPVYSNPYSVQVDGTSSTNVYAASTSGTKLMPILSSDNSVGAAITLPYNPNSMLASPTGTALLLGGDTKAMIYDVTNQSIGSFNFKGKVLAISPDGSYAIFFDQSPVATPSVPMVYVVTISTGAITTSIPFPPSTTTARASFSPDSLIAYIVGRNSTNGVDNTLAVWGRDFATRKPALAKTEPVNDVDFLAQGSYAFVAGADATQHLNAWAVCNNGPTAGGTGPAVAPNWLRSLPNGSGLIAVASPNIYKIPVNGLGDPTAPPATAGSPCTPPAWSYGSISSASFAPFTANQLLVAPNSTKAFLIDNTKTSVMVFNVADSTPSTIALANGATPTSGGFTLDSQSLYVGGSDQKVHRINLSTSADDTQVSLDFVPDLVVVRPF